MPIRSRRRSAMLSAMDTLSATRLAGVVLEQAAGQPQFEIDLLDEEATKAITAALQDRGCIVVRSVFKTVITVTPPAAKLDVS